MKAHLGIRVWTVSLAWLLAAGCTPPDGGRPDPAARILLRIAEAEDARPAGGPRLNLLVDATASASALERAAGARALGRMERPELGVHLVPLLHDPDAGVRAEAANALAQAYHTGDGAAALPALLSRLAEEQIPEVRGVLARSLGRLRLALPAHQSDVLAALAELADDAGRGAPPQEDARLLGVVLGYESVARRQRTLGDSHVERVAALARHGREGSAANRVRARIRGTALRALDAAGALTIFDVEGALRDAHPQVRRAGARGLASLPAVTRAELERRALLDESPQVRWEAVSALARRERDAVTCTRLQAAASRDLDVKVRLRALDALDRPCPDVGGQVAILVGAIGRLERASGGRWHEAVHALVALAALDPESAEELLAPFATHSDPFVRAWAARAAARLGSSARLAAFLGDENPNVRTAALTALAGQAPAEARAAAVRQLREADDPHLLLVAAGILAGSPNPIRAARDAAAEALERISTPRSQTLRDARMALLEVIIAHGEPEDGAVVEPYLRDHDPVLAARAADALRVWTGQRYLAAPRSMARAPLPSAADFRAMQEHEVVLHMARGGSIRIALEPRVALTNAFRFFRMAREGVLDGLTFHRVAPNFVIQGLSPGANEYAGWGAYTRDEVGLPAQWRGTVGVSTRGRDTGDGQIYINLIDNTRLDHDYTIFGTVVGGLDTADAVLEGDVIERAEVRPTG